MRHAILLSPGPTHLEQELTAQQHLFPGYAHIVTVICSRTRDPAAMMMGNLNEESNNHDARCEEFVKMKVDSCTHWKSETARESSPNLRMIRVKATPPKVRE